MFPKLIVAATVLLLGAHVAQGALPTIYGCNTGDCTGTCASSGVSVNSCKSRDDGRAYYKLAATGHTCGTCAVLTIYQASVDCGTTGTGAPFTQEASPSCGRCTWDSYNATSGATIYSKASCGSTVSVSFFTDSACTTATTKPGFPTSFSLNTCVALPIYGSTVSAKLTKSGVQCEWLATEQYSDSSCTTAVTAANTWNEDATAGAICTTVTSTTSTKTSAGACSSASQIATLIGVLFAVLCALF